MAFRCAYRASMFTVFSGTPQWDTTVHGIFRSAEMYFVSTTIKHSNKRPIFGISGGRTGRGVVSHGVTIAALWRERWATWTLFLHCPARNSLRLGSAAGTVCRNSIRL